MTTKVDLLSLINDLKSNTSCNDCGTFQVDLKRSSNCTHLLCERCHESRKTCPVCKEKLRGKSVRGTTDISTILLHLRGIYNFANVIENDSATKIKYLFVSTPYNYKRHHNGETRLHKDCRDGNLTSVESLVKSGMDVNVQDFAMWTLLHEAVLHHRVDVVELLLANGALVNVPGLDYVTPLHYAVQEKNEDIAKLLVQYGANCMAYNKDGKTPLDLCDSDRLRSAICMTNMLPLIVRTYKIPELRIFLDNFDEDFAGNVSKLTGVSLMKKRNLLDFADVNYFVTRAGNVNVMYLQAAMLQGAIICGDDFLVDLESKKTVLNPMNYFTEIPNYAISKAGLNALNKLPKLFDGIHFYFVNYSKRVVEGVEYTLEDIKTLIFLGGGKVDTRAPSGCNIIQSYPYHARKTESEATVSYYLIYDDRKTIKKKLFPKQVKYQTVMWLISSINSFSILPYICCFHYYYY